MDYSKLTEQAQSLQNRLNSESAYHILRITIQYGTSLRILQNRIGSETDNNNTHIRWNIGYSSNMYSVHMQSVSVSQWL